MTDRPSVSVWVALGIGEEEDCRYTEEENEDAWLQELCRVPEPEREEKSFERALKRHLSDAEYVRNLCTWPQEQNDVQGRPGVCHDDATSVAGTSNVVARTSAFVEGTPLAALPETVSNVIVGASNLVAGTATPVPGTSKLVAGASKHVAGTSTLVPGTSKRVAGTSTPVPGTLKPVAGTFDRGGAPMAQLHPGRRNGREQQNDTASSWPRLLSEAIAKRCFSACFTAP